jgi:DsbC/DsbD-like thiol-disulfide interchange protein/cytochrome c biogenesis protein CcdA
MRSFIRRAILAALFTVVMAANASAAAPRPHHMAVELVAETDSPAPGSTITLAVSMTPEKGWHGYWKRPGDAGFPTRLNWNLPSGASAGEAGYPVPTTLVIAGLMNHVFEQAYALLVPVQIPSGLAVGTAFPISLKTQYLVCTSTICVPESAEVHLNLTIGNGTVDQARSATFDAWRRTLPRPLGSPVTYERHGKEIRFAFPLPQAVHVAAPHLFAGTEQAIIDGATQTFARDGDRLIVSTAVGATDVPVLDGVLAIGDGTGLSFSATAGVIPSVPGSGAGPSVSAMLTALLAAIAGGLILNVMPCVFPILSLKALSLARAGGSEKEVRHEAIAYTVGAIAMCVILGSVILVLRSFGNQVGWAFQLQDPRIVFILVLLTGAIGFNLAGLFELGMISGGSELAARGGKTGAFWTGFLAAFVATPCTGPFMAGAVGAALVLPAAVAIFIFAGLGLGLALPFLALGYMPSLRRRLPRPGAWLDRLRKILAVPMFATALGLAWVLGHQTDADGVIVAFGGLLILAIGLWTTGLFQRGFRTWASWPALAATAIALGGLVLLPRSGTQPGMQPGTHSDAEAATTSSVVAFDTAKLAGLRAAGKPVFLYFTADWCLTCKVNERVAIDQPETRKAFAESGVTTMVGDWTNGDPAITRFLASQGRSGVPFYLWYRPHQDGTLLPQILSTSTLVAAARAR